MIVRHEVNRHPVTCDFCGFPIRAGETCRIVTEEHTGKSYREHIRCPGAPTAAVRDPRPVPPKIQTASNHAFHMA